MPQSEFLFEPLPHTAGFAFHACNPLIEEWIRCWNDTEPLLDIGCGNCINTLKGIQAEAAVVATELDRDSLQQLQEKYSHHQSLHFAYLELPGKIPCKNESISGLLCSEVFHFLDHEEIIASILEFHRVLKVGGKVILTCASEDIAMLSQVGLKQIRRSQREAFPQLLRAYHHHLELLEQACQLKPENHFAWELIQLHQHTYRNNYFNFFHPGQLAEAFRDKGFSITLAETGPAPYYPLWEHGDHDQVRLIAVKE
ncbi:class I SAM-dependent methyltransferase [Endozoicomonas numazuensis]|uniref:Methyltransferase type 11 domain-containing protein n=1 Tax=Endozoicomonas numazuensis TaxID=1137799 RepID=A0A081NEJ2_9GAMM|nr:class I SAM-dependent methyltransferase [Endozoicomonas numazuensis]KEQ16865.1 hypothetical protein GZ78_19590 [Endozoicomonas numazuensis]